MSASVYIPVAIIPAGEIAASENGRWCCRWQNRKARIGGASEYGPEGEARLRSQASFFILQERVSHGNRKRGAGGGAVLRKIGWPTAVVGIG